MKPPYSEEEIKSYFDSFERMGEAAVRAAINSDSWRYEQVRLGAAKEWVRQKDEARIEARRVPESKSWHERAWGKIIIGFIIALLAWFFGFFANQYLQKGQLQYQPKDHEEIQKK
jgi:hypothetical protein